MQHVLPSHIVTPAAMLRVARALGLMMPTQCRSSSRLHLQKLCSSHG